MLRSYLTMAVRTLGKNRVHTFINIFGLSVGLASCLLILLFVRHELSFENWLPEAERIHAVQSTQAGPDGATLRSARTPRVAAHMLPRELPQIEQAAAITQERAIATVADRPQFVELSFAHPNLFQILQLPLLRGDPRTALARPGNVVLTESEALRLLGSTDIVGRTLTIRYRGQPEDLTVSGVLRNLPGKTHLKLSVITPYANEMFGIHEGEAGSWAQVDSFVYAKLRPGASAAAIGVAMPSVVRRNIPDSSESEPTALHLVPVRDLYLDHSNEGSMKPGGDRVALTAFSLIALLILTIACVNFTNLATAQGTQRAREVALRKVLGARRGQLAAQFLTEALLLTMFATIVALALVELFLPSFSALVRADLSLSYFGSEGVLAPTVLLAGAVALVCGIYPAFVLSRHSPGAILRSYQATVQGGGRLGNLLVISQFAISIGLIVCTAVIYAQTKHARAADPGYDQSGLIVVENLDRNSPENRVRFYDRVRQLPGVRSAARSDVAPADEQETTGQFHRPGNPKPLFLNYNAVDWGFRDTLRLPLLAGRFLQEERGGDDASAGYNPYGDDAQALLSRGVNVVVSASAARRLGFQSPAAALGQQIQSPFLSRPELVPSTIVGVVGDAQYRSVRDQSRPTVYRFNPTSFTYLVARYEGVDPRRLRTQVEGIWNELYPNVPFEGDFAEDRVAGLYLADQARGRVFAAAAILAILVACLGLFGLAAFTAERRTKEIGIRKVFGANTSDILRLLVWQFCQPVLLANILAWPVAWWLMRDWLNQFSARISLHPGWFVSAGAAALLIAALTVVAHAWRVARTNPIHALRYE